MSEQDSDVDFIESFLRNVDERKKSKTSFKSTSSTSVRGGSSLPKLTLDKPVLPSIGISFNDDDGMESNLTVESIGKGRVDWKRKSKLETSFHYEKHDSADENSVDDSDDDEDVIRKMAARATMHRRPTIALALMSSSEEEMNFDSDEDDEEITEMDNLALLQNFSNAQRQLSQVKQLQYEFPGMEFTKEDAFDEEDEKPKGINKFKKIGTTIKLVSSLSTKIVPDMGDRPSMDSGIPGRSSTQNARQRRAALATAEQNEETNMRRQVEKILTEKEHLFVLHPHSSVRFYWDLASIIILLINVVTIPLELSFFFQQGNQTLAALKLVTDIWFICDMMLNFRTGVFRYHIRKVLEMDPTEIRRLYIKGWFFIDLIATFPFDVFFDLILLGSTEAEDSSKPNLEYSGYFKIGRVLKIFALLRILRLGRFVRYLHQWEEHLNMDYGFAENMVKFFTWIFIMFMVGHWNACILYLIPSAGPQAVQDLAHPDNPRWDGDQRGFGPGDSLDQSWIFSSGVHYKVTDPNLFGEAYFWSLFKSFSHMLSIGYGVNTANVQTDMIGTIFALFVGKLVFALFLSQMISLIDSINMSEKIFKRHLQEVDDYLRFNRTPVPLKRAVKDFYEYHYKQKIFDEDTILSELNPLLYEEVVTCGIINYIKECDFFRTCREDLQRKLCHLFKVEMYQPYTNIIMAGRIASSFYIIRQGIIACENDDGRGDIYHLGEGDYFGLESFATIVNPRSVTTIMSESWVEVLQINIREMKRLETQHPEFADELKLIIALGNENLKRNGLYPRIISKQRDAKLFYG